mgnify:CR=1 FL=1
MSGQICCIFSQTGVFSVRWKPDYTEYRGGVAKVLCAAVADWSSVKRGSSHGSTGFEHHRPPQAVGIAAGHFNVEPSRGVCHHPCLRLLKEGDYLVPLHRGESFEKLVDGFSGLEASRPALPRGPVNGRRFRSRKVHDMALGCQLLHTLGRFLLRLPKVVLHLHPKPEVGAGAERFG